MKLFLSGIAVLLSLSATFYDPIMATVVFENLTEKTAVSGVFYVIETNQKFEITTLDDFNIELPRTGKYKFRFYSEDVNAFTHYPVKITDRKNIITVRLESTSKSNNEIDLTIDFTTIDLSNVSKYQMKDYIAKGFINFVNHGLVALHPETYKAFKNEYGVGFVTKNCAVDPISYRITNNNNKTIAAYLTELYGNDWKRKLPIRPFGIQL